MNYTEVNSGSNETLLAGGIPFCVNRTEGIIRPIEGEIEINAPAKSLFLLGMSINHWEMSEWWGQQETRGDLSLRVFIGDTIEKLRIIYADDTQDVLPIIMGVNCWPYDLYFKAQPWEKGLVTLDGPYNEPMHSEDIKARQLMEKSLRMRLNDDPAAEKCTRWVYAHNLRPGANVKKIIRQVVKAKGVCIGAVTLGDEYVPDAPDLDFYLKKDWFWNLDAFSRYLYQYRDEMPQNPELLPTEPGRPIIEFTGSPTARVFTNVYRTNIRDMAYGKVTDDGKTHTSSGDTLNYCYTGFGAYNHFANYFNTVCSRDVGRTLIELCHYGYGERTKLAAKELFEYAYYPSVKYKFPRWKCDASTVFTDPNSFMGNEGLANDAQASIMMAMYALYQEGYVGKDWIIENRQALRDVADNYAWQIEHPELSHFDRTLYSNSEPSETQYGGYDLFSNAISVKALECYARMFRDIGEEEYAQKLIETSRIIRKGVEERFTMRHPRFGNVYTDTTDSCWTYEYKRFCYALMASDMDGYDLFEDDPELFDKLNRTFFVQKEEYYHPESGREMGYGQGYLTLTSLILDKYDEYSDCIDASAYLSFHHSTRSYIVPEGVTENVMRDRWVRNNDLGNGVQQAEIVKCARLILGIDDMDKAKPLRLVPRLPKAWQSIKAEDFPVFTKNGREYVNMEYFRTNAPLDGSVCALSGEEGYALKTSGANWDTARLGPFASSDICVYGAQRLKTTQIDGRYYVYVRAK